MKMIRGSTSSERREEMRKERRIEQHKDEEKEKRGKVISPSRYVQNKL
jgi:hypothetical protein